MFDGLASFNEREARDWLNGRIYFFNPTFLHIERSNCLLKRLDDLALRPDFIKIDVQGYELLVLKGGLNTLIANEPVLLIESPGADIIEFLNDVGYTDYAFESGTFYPRRTGGLNTYFMTLKRFNSIVSPVSVPEC